jgi:hypothetical protein
VAIGARGLHAVELPLQALTALARGGLLRPGGLHARIELLVDRLAASDGLRLARGETVAFGLGGRRR